MIEIKKMGTTIEVEGVIKSISDSQMLIDAINQVSSSGSVILKIKDSFSIPSTVIGHLLKQSDSGVNITIEVSEDILYELLDDLGLASRFNVRKV
jgi:hypothetical protein